MKIIKKEKINLGEIIQALRRGKVIICPTDTVYGLVADATNKKSVAVIFKIKQRNFRKTVSIFVKDLKMAKKFAKINKEQEKFLNEFWPGKMIAVLKSKKKFPPGIVCQWGKIGVRIPKYKLLNEILNRFKGPLAQTSANLSGQPTPTAVSDVLKQFKNKKLQPDMAIDAGKLAGQPSMVVDFTQSPPKTLRS